MSNTPPGITTDWTNVPGPQPYLEWVDASKKTNWITFPLVKSETWDEGATVTEHPVEVGADVADHVRVNLRRCTLVIRSTNEPDHVGPYMGTTRTNAGPISLDLPLPTPKWTPPSDTTLTVPEWDNLIEIRALAEALIGIATGGATGRVGELAVAAADIIVGDAVQGVRSFGTITPETGLPPPSPGNAVTAQLTGFATPEDFVGELHTKLRLLKNAATIFRVIGSKSGCSSMVIEELSFVRDADTGTGEMLTIGLKQVRIVSSQNVPAPIPRLSAGGGVPPVKHGGQTTQDAPPKTQDLILRGIKWLAPGVYAALPPATP